MTTTDHVAVFIKLICATIDASDKSQRQIALDAGFDKPNVLSMIKTGIMKVPMDKIVPLADALGLDRAMFLSLGLRAYMPSLLEVVEEQYGFLVSANERRWIAAIREISGGRNPSLTPKIRKMLELELAT